MICLISHSILAVKPIKVHYVMKHENRTVQSPCFTSKAFHLPCISYKEAKILVAILHLTFPYWNQEKLEKKRRAFFLLRWIGSLKVKTDIFSPKLIRFPFHDNPSNMIIEPLSENYPRERLRESGERWKVAWLKGWKIRGLEPGNGGNLAAQISDSEWKKRYNQLAEKGPGYNLHFSVMNAIDAN